MLSQVATPDIHSHFEEADITSSSAHNEEIISTSNSLPILNNDIDHSTPDLHTSTFDLPDTYDSNVPHITVTQNQEARVQDNVTNIRKSSRQVNPPSYLKHYEYKLPANRKSVV